MKIPDGPNWSPDGGRMWVKNNVIYWHDGDVTDLNSSPCACLRLMPGGYEHTEDYSAWTFEHRAEVWAASQERYRKNKEAEAAREACAKSLRESAKGKLTSEEIEACGL